MSESKNRTIDTLTPLEDGAAAIVASGAGSDILDLGTGHAKGHVIVDVSVLDFTDTDETYKIIIEGSPDAAFGTVGNIRPLGSLDMSYVLEGASTAAAVIGQYLIPFSNSINNGVTTYRYIRLYVAGATPAGITFVAYLGK